MRQSPSQKSLANIAKFLVKMKRTILAMILALYCIVSFAQQKSKSKIDKTPKKVVPTTPKTSTSDNNAPLTWLTDVMKADSISKKTNRPILVFLQEVIGVAGVTNCKERYLQKKNLLVGQIITLCC